MKQNKQKGNLILMDKKLKSIIGFLKAQECANKLYSVLFLFLLMVLLFFTSACKSSSTIKNSRTGESQKVTIVQETGKPLTYQEMVKRFDLNKDGVLDENEIENVQKTLGTRQPTFTKSTNEEQTIRRALILPGKAESKSEDPILSKYDINHDGILDENEVNILKNDLKSGATTEKPIKPKKQSTVVTTPVIKSKRNPIVR